MSRQARSDQPASEYATFTAALKKVLSVPRSEMQRRLAVEKKRKESTRSASSLSRDSHGKH
jgi:hypothetical protein